MTILITGAGGFIGSNLTEEMIRRGYEVRAMAQYNSQGSYGWLDTIDDLGCEKILGDVRDPDSVYDCMKGCDAVIHLAALIGVPYSYTAPRSYIDTNVTGTLNVLQVALDRARVVCTSTSEVYGTGIGRLNEDSPLNAQSPYAASKIAADQLALSFYRSFNSEVAIVRPFNTYGPRQSLRAVIPSIIKQVIERDMVRLGTKTSRSFTYVSDTVDGIIKVYESANCTGSITNIGMDSSYEITAPIAFLEKELGKVIKLQADSSRSRPSGSEVHSLNCDYTKARREIGWEPKIEFGPGVVKTYEWFSQNMHLYGKGNYAE